ncbi:MAG: hypothetical protein RMJ89_07995, partial [Flammeovirgaceae bacterium]|nr:hypothetical protein [Flammeovirgaceae bacterium]
MRKINTLGWICGCCFLLASIQQAHPQALCSKIRFKEGNSKGCVGMIVTLTDDDNTVPDVYFFEHIAGSRDFRLGNRQGQGFDNSHQFNTPGVYAVRGVFGSGNGAQSVDCLGFIEIFENKLPDLRILNCPNRRLFLEVTDFGTFDEVWVDAGDNTQYVLTKNTEKKIHTYANEGTFTVKYQGRFNGGFSNCITESRQVLSANQLPPILLEELSVTNNQIILNVGFSPLVRLELAEKKDNGIFNTVGQVGGSIRTVVLSNRTPENTIYYYQVQTSSHCGSEKMSNQLASVYLKGQAKAQENFLTWQRYWGEGFEKYQLLRDGQVYKEFTDKEKTSFSDTSPFVQCKKVYQYQVVVRLNNGWKITTNLVSLTTSEMISPAPPA